MQLDRLRRRIPERRTADELQEELDAVALRKRQYPMWVTLIAAMMACSGFAFLNNGGWQECLSVALAVFITQWARMRLGRIGLNPLVVYGVCGLLASFGYIAFSALLVLLSGQTSALHDAGFTSSLLLLVPGFPLMAGVLDLGRLDIASGISRLTFSVLVLMSVSLGAWAVTLLFDLRPAAAPAPEIPLLALDGARLLAGFVAVCGFAMMFNTPFRFVLAAAGVGSVANVLRLTANDAGFPGQVSTLAAALVVGLLAYFVARWVRTPRIILTVPAVLIMIPGSAAYRCLVYMNAGDFVAAAGYGLQAFFEIVSLAVGLTVARMLTEREWSREPRPI